MSWKQNPRVWPQIRAKWCQKNELFSLFYWKLPRRPFQNWETSKDFEIFRETNLYDELLVFSWFHRIFAKSFPIIRFHKIFLSHFSLKCSMTHDVTWEPILNCAKSEEGSKLMAVHGDDTHSLRPKLTFVPHIVMNGKHIQPKDALTNFRHILCSAFRGTRPQKCIDVI